MSERRETKIIHGEDFEKMLISAVADAVTRANEATVTRVAALESELADTKARLSAAEQRLEDIENYSRRNCVIISGVPENTGESTDRLVVDVGKTAGLNLTNDCLDRSHRLGRAQPGKTRPIIAKFLSYNTRQKLFDSRKELSAENVKNHPSLTRSVVSRVFISECLSPRNQHLLFVARQLRKKKALWAAYTTNGRVKVKKAEADAAKTITALEDLEAIVGSGTMREFQPRATAADRTQPETDPTWQAADAVNAWVTDRRSGRSAAGRSHKGDGPRS